jgi:hypothetical protein
MHHQDPCPSGHAGPQPLTRSTLWQNLHLLCTWPLRPRSAPAPIGVTGSTFHHDPRPLGCGPQVHTGSMLHWDPCPSGPPTFRPCWAPALCGTTRYMPCQDPHPLGPAQSTPWGGSMSLGTGHQLSMRQLHPPSNWDPYPSSLAWPQLYRLTRLQLRLPLEGSKPA